MDRLTSAQLTELVHRLAPPRPADLVARLTEMATLAADGARVTGMPEFDRIRAIAIATIRELA